MARKNKRPAFDESDGDDAQPGKGFQEYLKSKSAQSAKKSKSSEAVEAALSAQSAPIAQDPLESEQSRSSSVIKGLLVSKKQREQDKLHIQSVRSRLESELNKPKNSEDLTFITDSYRVKREEYDRADRLAQHEREQEASKDSDEELTTSSKSVALRLLMNNETEGDEQPTVETLQSSKISSPIKTKFENDVYKSPSFMPIAPEARKTGSQLELDPEQKLLCAREFLKSTKTAQDIEKIRKTMQ